MIMHLTGTVIDTSERYFVLDNNDIGYKVFSTGELCRKASKKQTLLSVWIHHVIREDTSDLYGFETKDDLDFFEQLISISGIGPKSALGVMNVSPTTILRQAIATEDTSHLTKVSGIGKKLAEKIVLELKDKIHLTTEESDSNLKGEVDVLEALKTIGYSHEDVRDALKGIPADIKDTKERIRYALKKLGK